MYWIDLFQDKKKKLVGYFEHGDELLNCMNCREILDWLRTSSFSIRTMFHGVVSSLCSQSVSSSSS